MTSPIRFAIAAGDLTRLAAEREARAGGKAQPMTIRMLLDDLSDGGATSLEDVQRDPHIVGFAYHFDRRLLTWALAGRPYLFLCWGLPKRGPLRGLAARFMLRRARHVLANDPVSEGEARRLASRVVEMLPFPVDTDFYTYADTGQRDDFLFCPSSNDRDADLLIELARRGHKLVWLNNDAEMVKRCHHVSQNLKIVSHIPFEDLRGLYQSCRACILPIARDVHAAGQTTTLEAISSGAPVFITKGRTSAIFAGDGLVTEIAGNDPNEWNPVVAEGGGAIGGEELQRRRNVVERHHHPKEVGKRILTIAEAV